MFVFTDLTNIKWQPTHVAIIVNVKPIQLHQLSFHSENKMLDGYYFKK